MRPAARHTARSDRAGVRGRRTVPLIAGLIAIGLLVSGCGGSSPRRSAGRPSAASFGRQFVAFADCMRSHGLPDYPDPQISSSGGQVQVKISPGSLNPNSPAFKSADKACHELLPNGGAPGAAGANSAQERAQRLKFAVCMRSLGVPNFPDPDHDGAFDLPSGINLQAPQFQRAMQACTKARPTSLTINQARGGS